MSSPALAASAAAGKMCEHCHTAKAQAKVTFNGVTLKLCKPCLEIEQKRVHLARLCERCAQGKQVRRRSPPISTTGKKKKRKIAHEKNVFFFLVRLPK